MGTEYHFAFKTENKDYQFDLVPTDESEQVAILDGIQYAVVVGDPNHLPVIQKFIQNALSPSITTIQDFERCFKALPDIREVQVHAIRKTHDIGIAHLATAPKRSAKIDTTEVTRSYQHTANQTAVAVRDYAKSLPIGQSLIPAPEYGERIITEREFKAASEFLSTCEEVQVKIGEDVNKFIEEIDFNPLHFVRDYLKHYESEKIVHSSITAEEAFKSFKPDSTNQALVDHGATCVGRSIDILQVLERKYQLRGHVVVETLGPAAPPTHAAAIVLCKDGIVLIDVMFDEPVCTIKYSLDSPEVIQKMSVVDRAHYSFQIVNLSDNLGTKDVVLHKREVTVQKGESKTSQKQILLRTIQSADQPVMKKFMLNSDSYPIYNGSSHMLIVYVKDQKIRCMVGRGATAIRAELPFSAFNLETRTIDRNALKPEERELFLTEKFFKEFKTSPQVMMDEIFLIIKHYETLKSLFQSAGTPF